VKITFFVPPFKLGAMFVAEIMTEYHTVGAVGRTAVIHGVVKLRKMLLISFVYFSVY
jgi:hypothetical protein